MTEMNKPKSEREKIKETTKRTTARLIKEVAKSEGILAAIGDGVSILDRTFKIFYQNQAEKDMMGDHVGEFCYKAYAKRQGICGGCPVALTFKDEKVHIVQRELQTDKGIRYAEITASPLKDPQGKIIAGIEVVRDITERKQIEDKLREEEERYRLLFNNVSNAIFVHEVTQDISDIGKFKIIEVNDNACKYLGYTREELLQMNISELDAPETLGNIPALLNKLFTEGNATWEGIHIHKDGHRIPVEISNQLFELYGKPMVLAAVRDITERKQAEEALRESGARYRSYIEVTGQIAWVTNAAGEVVEDVPSLRRFSGQTYEEARGSGWAKALHPDDIDRTLKVWQNSVTTRSPYEIEYRMRRHDGVYRDLLARGFPVLSEDGRIREWVGTCIDITERKQAEELIRESEEKYRLLAESSEDYIMRYDRQHRHTYMNPACLRAAGFSQNDIIGKTHRESGRFNEELCNFWEEKIEYVFDTGKPLQSEFKWESAGGLVVLDWRLTPEFAADGSVKSVLGVSRDITERKQVEEALRESEKRYGKLIDSLTDYLYTVELKNGQPVLTKHGQGCVAVTGYTSEEYEADLYLWYRMVYEEDKEAVMKQVEKIISGKVVKSIEHRIIHKNGEIKWVRNTVAPRLNEEGVLIAYDGLIENITDRKETEEKLYASEKKFRTLFNSANDAIAIHDMEGHFLEVNETICKRLGYSYEELINMTPMDIDTTENAAHIRERIEELLQRKYLIFETAHICRDGTVIPVEVSSRIIDYNGAPAVLSIARDITERKQAEEEKVMLEEQLLHAQKMEAIGQLAGGIAHDFNNILTAIIGFGNLLQMEIGKDIPLNTYITRILSSAQRGANLTQGLLAFSRRQIISPKPVNMNEIIKGLETFLSGLIGEDIELSIVLKDKDLIIMADSNQVEQVLMNLATNSRDAMPDGGRLIIRTDIAEFDSEFVKAHGFGRPGSYALISVNDTGEGIDEKTKERIFEPFFTTKDVGKGTGLGLSMVYGIIKQHGGYVNVYSEPGKGTTFNIYIPLIESEIIEKKPEDLSILKGGTETILVAEDDAIVRQFMMEMLKAYGYTVIEVEDGEEAIRAFNENKDKIHLLILDVIMPKKNGKEVYNEVKKVRPDIKNIFISGYDADIIHKKGIVEEGLNFISKPILLNDFLKKVREILDR